MPYPTPIVEIGFDHGPYELNPTWTPVTQWCWSMTTDRGRSDDWGDFDGSATVVLNNRDRRFDPFNTSGPYYGKLLPRRQIRIRAQTTDGGVTVTHDVFRGFIDGWAPSWTDAGTNSTVTLSCFDALQFLASEQLPADWSRNYILSTNPRHYWPCDEPISPYVANTTLTDYGSYPQNMLTTSIATNGSQLAVGLVNSSVQGTTGISALTSFGAVGSATSFTVSFWAILDPDTGNCNGEIGNCNWNIGYTSSTSKYTVLILDSASGVYRQYTTTTTYDGGSSRMISFSFNQSSKAFSLYLDGILAPTSVITGAQIYIPIGEQTNIGGGQVQQLIIWSSVVSQAVIQDVYRYSTVNLPETTSARFQRIIAETLFPTALTSPASSPVNSVLDITDDAPSVAPELRLVASSEGGPLFVSKAGVLTMFNMNQQFTQTNSVVSQVTYGVGGADMGQDVQLSPDGDSIRNAVNVAMSGGGVWTQENVTSRNAYGVASMSYETQVQTLANAQSLGNMITGWGGINVPRTSPIDVILDSANNWSPTMALELCERITVKILPPSGGNTVTIPMLVQNIHHEYVPGYWQTTLEGSARWASVFIIGQSLIGGTDLLG